MILMGYDYGGGCVSTMFGKRLYLCLLHFKESGRMRVAKPEKISQQTKARRACCLGMRRYRSDRLGQQVLEVAKLTSEADRCLLAGFRQLIGMYA
jgi:hypothetical protein